MKTIILKVEVPRDCTILKDSSTIMYVDENDEMNVADFTEIHFPTDENVVKEIKARFSDEYIQQEIYKLIDKYKRETLGELFGYKQITG